MISCVYFLQLQPDGAVKIGTTTGHVSLRVRALQQTSPHVLKWIGFFPGARKEEAAAHKLLSGSRLRGEWFHPTREVLAFINEKSPNFSETKFNDAVFMETERSIVKRAIPRWRGKDEQKRICDASGYGIWNLHKWLTKQHLPDPDMAAKAAICAAEILREAA